MSHENARFSLSADNGPHPMTIQPTTSGPPPTSTQRAPPIRPARRSSAPEITSPMADPSCNASMISSQSCGTETSSPRLREAHEGTQEMIETPSSDMDAHPVGRFMSSARSPTEKKDRRRRQNNESSRRSRERKRIELESLQKAHASDQLRITQLEHMVDHLTNELRKHECNAQLKPASSEPRPSQNPRNDPRPEWFGSAF